MELYEEFFKLVPALNRAGVKYAIVGGIALAFHQQPRFTRDIDIACPAADLDATESALAKLGFSQSTDPWNLGNTGIRMYRFIKTEGEDHLVIDLLASQNLRFLELFSNTVPESSEAGIVQIASKQDLIWLKSLRGSDQDQVDIKALRDDENRENS